MPNSPVKLKGTAWVCPDFTDSYKILPSKYWMGGESVWQLNAEELAPHVMEGFDPNFAAQAKEGKYQFIVAGKMFGGGGKSIEHPIYAIKGAGIKAVLAESISRYFYRNLINNGVSVLICKGITEAVHTGDELEVDLSAGKISVVNGTTLVARPLPEIALKIIAKGGYINYMREKLETKT
jgi:3-isopropylmalate/(R)-2-methylmalate dehydratase small subunit